MWGMMVGVAVAKQTRGSFLFMSVIDLLECPAIHNACRCSPMAWRRRCATFANIVSHPIILYVYIYHVKLLNIEAVFHFLKIECKYGIHFYWQLHWVVGSSNVKWFIFMKFERCYVMRTDLSVMYVCRRVIVSYCILAYF